MSKLNMPIRVGELGYNLARFQYGLDRVQTTNKYVNFTEVSRNNLGSESYSGKKIL